MNDCKFFKNKICELDGETCMFWSNVALREACYRKCQAAVRRYQNSHLRGTTRPSIGGKQDAQSAQRT